MPCNITSAGELELERRWLKESLRRCWVGEGRSPVLEAITPRALPSSVFFSSISLKLILRRAWKPLASETDALEEPSRILLRAFDPFRMLPDPISGGVPPLLRLPLPLLGVITDPLSVNELVGDTMAGIPLGEMLAWGWVTPTFGRKTLALSALLLELFCAECTWYWLVWSKMLSSCTSMERFV